MALNLDGFSTPQQSYEGLFKLGDDLRQKKYTEEQRDYQRAQAQQGRKDANDKYFTNLLNPKDYLTGTHYDPNTVKLLGEATQQAYELSAKGADYNQITMAIAPLVQKVADYSSKAKMYQQNLKALNERMGKEKGWNLQRVNELLEDYTFYKVDPKTSEKTLDVDAADPSLKSAMERIDAENLHEVTTADGFNTWADKFPKMAQQATVGNPNKFGSQHTRKLGVTAANWEMPEEDDKGNITFVPKYEVATDNRVPLQHEFVQPDGTVVKAPIRLLDKNFFESILSDKDAARYLRARVQQEIKEYKDENGNPITLNSPKAELVARAVAYDLLKARAGGVVNQSDVRTQSPVETRFIITGQPYAPQRSSGSGSGEDAQINDVFRTVAQKVQADKGKGYTYTRFNALSGLAQRTILKYVKETTGEGSDLTNQSNLYITTDASGKMILRKKEDDAQPNPDKDPALFDLDYTDLNLPNQADVKGKRGVVAGGKSPQSTSTPKKKISW